MKEKTQYEALMEELQKMAENFRARVVEIGDTLAKILPDVEIPEEEEDTWEMKCPYEDGDEYYLLDDSGSDYKFEWDGRSVDKKRFSQGNAFPTKEAAELESKRRNLLTRFRAFRDECNGDWKADWENIQKAKYYIGFSDRKLEARSNYYLDIFPAFGYFKNEEDAERAIELFGDKIKELFVDNEWGRVK